MKDKKDYGGIDGNGNSLAWYLWWVYMEIRWFLAKGCYAMSHLLEWIADGLDG